MDTTSRGFTQAQLASTASYQAKNLQGIGLRDNDLTGWDFSGQNLTNANLASSTLTNANLSGAVVTGANFGAAPRRVASPRPSSTSTASYQAKDLQGIGLADNDLTGWDFSGQNLTNADLSSSTLTNANLSGANLKNANLNEAADVQSAVFASSTIYNQWTVFPDGFDPVTSGLTLMPSPIGDFDANDALDIADIDLLQFRIRNGYANPFWLPTTMFDLNSDDEIDLEDLGVWVKDLKHTWFGDANLDGEFNSADLVVVFQAGHYEVRRSEDSASSVNPATWSEGDWDGDGEFNSSDLDRGPRRRRLRAGTESCRGGGAGANEFGAAHAGSRRRATTPR